MRHWSPTENDGSIHAIGNGGMLAYGQGPDVMQLAGPPYSAPSYLSLRVSGDCGDLRAESSREPGTAVWRHSFYRGGECIARAVDYMPPEEAAFIREIDAADGLELVLTPAPGARMEIFGSYIRAGAEPSASLSVTLPKGSTFFTHDSIIEERNLLATCSGSAALEGRADGCAVLRIRPGRSRILLCGGSLPQAVELSERILAGGGDRLGRALEYWRAFTAKRTDFAGRIPEGHPLRARMLEAIDSVSVLIKCQQSRDGGVAAGHFYPMAYVRDQAGVFRGLMALGYTGEARAILEFWMRKWALFGNLYNAEGMGNDHARLFFTNDEVEIPAYVVLCCAQYFERTGDEALFRKQLPMLRWALDVQLGHLADGMTEFSGDETYIAGGTFPKYLIFQGSAESTLLLVTGGMRLLDAAEALGLWSAEETAPYRERLGEAIRLYKRNFVSDGRLYANNPSRDRRERRPRFIYTYCYVHEAVDKQGFFSWLELTPEGFYACPACRGRKMPEGIVDWNRREELSSVSLVPAYIGSPLFTGDELRSITAPAFALFGRTGSLPSNLAGTRALGYDYGLLLYNLVKLGHPLAEKALEKMLGLLDATDAWVEYYDGDRPFNCRARPWESAINIEAAIEYVKTL